MPAMWCSSRAKACSCTARVQCYYRANEQLDKRSATTVVCALRAGHRGLLLDEIAADHVCWQLGGVGTQKISGSRERWVTLRGRLKRHRVVIKAKAHSEGRFVG